jgi:hypothetical protein
LFGRTLRPWLSGGIALLAAVYVLAEFFEHDVSSNGYYLLAGLGFVALLAFRGALPRDRQALRLFAAFGLFVGIAFVVTWLSGFPHGGMADIEKRFAKLLLAIPAYYAFSLAGADERWVWKLSMAGAAACGVAALIHLLVPELSLLLPMEEYTLDEHPGRIYANANPIDFGAASLVHVTLLGAGYRYFFSKRPWGKIAWAVAMSLGLLAVVLSGTRGIWLVLPVVAVLMLKPIVQNSTMGSRWLLAGTVVLVLVWAWHIPIVKQRVNSAVAEISHYSESRGSSDVLNNSSVGLRLEMWRTAWTIFKNHPWSGVGQKGYRLHARRLIATGEANAAISRFDHPHNQYLSSLTQLGVIGFGALLLCLWIPARHFWRLRHEPDQAIAALGLAGLLVVCIYAIAGLTEANFESRVQMSLYGFSLALLYAAIRRSHQLSGISNK